MREIGEGVIMKLSKKSPELEEVKSIINWMATPSNSGNAEQAIGMLEAIQEEIEWLKNAILDARQAFWDGEAPEIIGSRFEEIAAYIDLEEN